MTELVPHMVLVSARYNQIHRHTERSAHHSRKETLGGRRTVYGPWTNSSLPVAGATERSVVYYVRNSYAAYIPTPAGP